MASVLAPAPGRGGGRSARPARAPARDGHGARVPPGVLGRASQTWREARFLIGLVLVCLAPGFSHGASFTGPPASGPPPALSPDTSGARAVPAASAKLPKPRPVLTIASSTLLGGYRRFIGSQDVPSCRFAPSCSGFMQEAIERGGLFQGVLFGADRVTRCHSWSWSQAPARETARRTDGPIPDPVAWYLHPATSTVPRSGPGRRTTAALLSGVLPGAGKVYCGRGVDGLQSLLIVGTAALLASRGFERDGRRSLEGWGAAGVGAVFHVGGIFGAAASADLRAWRDAEKRPRVRASRAGSETSDAPHPGPGNAGVSAGDGVDAPAMAGSGGSRTPGGDARAQPFLDRGAAAPGISPATAVLFSSIVPGSGQMLSGSPGRGLNALVLDAGLGAGVGVLARDGRMVEAALLFALGFLRYYHGNLYWAARLATERSGRPGPDHGHER